MQLTALLALVPALSFAGPEDWPHWLGPNRDGVSRETGWSSVGATDPVWFANVGLGYSCVAIADGRLYTLGHDAEALQDRIFCLDAATGEERWRFTYPAATGATFHGGGTLTTPSIEGERAYVTDREGRVFCLATADGTVLWQRNYRDELSTKPTMYGCSASALVRANHLIVVQGGNVLSLAKEDGEVLWRSEDYGDGGYANPVPFPLRGQPALAIFTGLGLVVLDEKSGEELHRHPWKGEAGGINASTPVPIGERMFISSAYGMGAALLEFEAGESEAKLLWRTRRMRNKVSGCILWRDHLYGFDESMLKCFDLQGEERWRVRGLGMGAIALSDDRLIVLSSEGELIVAEASPGEYRELSRHKVLDGGVYWTAPVIVGGLIYCRNSLGDLVCMDHRGGEGVAGAPSEIEGPYPTPADLFDSHLAAIGGAEALAGRRSLHLEGEFESTGAGITRTSMTIDRMRPNRYRRSYDIGPYGKVVHCYDGELGWQLDPFYGDQVFGDEVLRELRETLHLDGDARYRELYPKMRTLGPATFGARPCWSVEVTSEEGATRRFYFDRETGLKVGREGDAEEMLVHSDYRDFEGILLPTYSVALDPETGEEERMWITSAAWNEVKPEAFERPAAILRMLRTPEQLEAANAELRTRYGHLLGTYVANFPGFEEAESFVVVEKGDLVLRITGAPDFALGEPDEEERFPFIGRPGMYVTPVTAEDGTVTALIFHMPQGDQELRRKRE